MRRLPHGASLSFPEEYALPHRYIHIPLLPASSQEPPGSSLFLRQETADQIFTAGAGSRHENMPAASDMDIHAADALSDDFHFSHAFYIHVPSIKRGCDKMHASCHSSHVIFITVLFFPWLL